MSSFFFWLALPFGGFVAGCTTGLIGMGGSLMLVPLSIGLGMSTTQAVGTSALAMFATTLAGSWHNWRRGNLDWQQVLALGIPALLTAQVGAYLTQRTPTSFLLSEIALLLVTSIYFARQKKHLQQLNAGNPHLDKWAIALRRILIGSLAGFVSGLLGISGGVVIVPSQILLLQTGFEAAVQTSIGVMILGTASAFVGHELRGNVLPLEGLVLGLAGAIGIQVGVRVLPRLRQILAQISCQAQILMASIYISWQELVLRFAKKHY